MFEKHLIFLFIAVFLATTAACKRRSDESASIVKADEEYSLQVNCTDQINQRAYRNFFRGSSSLREQGLIGTASVTGTLVYVGDDEFGEFIGGNLNFTATDFHLDEVSLSDPRNYGILKKGKSYLIRSMSHEFLLRTPVPWQNYKTGSQFLTVLCNTPRHCELIRPDSYYLTSCEFTHMD